MSLPIVVLISLTVGSVIGLLAYGLICFVASYFKRQDDEEHY